MGVVVLADATGLGEISEWTVEATGELLGDGTMTIFTTTILMEPRVAGHRDRLERLGRRRGRLAPPVVNAQSTRQNDGRCGPPAARCASARPGCGRRRHRGWQ